jgi:tetratricopeptide (TPR) repeat protein
MQGEIFCELEWYEEALAAFGQAVQQEPGNLSYWQRQEEIRALLKQSEEDRAQSKSKEKKPASPPEKSVPQKPSGKDLYDRAITLFYTSKKYEEALAAFREAVLLEPKNINYLQGLGRALESLERYGEALEVSKELARLQPKISTHLQMQAELLWKLKRYEEAIALYDQAISVEPRRVYRQRQEELRAQLQQRETGLQKFLKFLRN